MSTRTRTRRQEIYISPVGMNPNEQLSLAQKFPNYHICNVRPDHLALILQSAKELEFNITAGAPRNSMYADSIGIYVSDFSKNPADLLERFTSLKLAAWNAARAKGATP